MNLLVLDTTSILFRHFYASKAYDDEDAIINGLVTMQAIRAIHWAYNKYSPDAIIATFDRSSWRKALTLNDPSIGFIYKGNRDEKRKKDKREKEKYESFRKHIDGFEQLLREHTTILTLGQDMIEGDDFCARIVQLYGDQANAITVVTGDSDLIQLKRPNVEIINVADPKKKPFNLKEWDNDPEFYLFQKIIRGDKQSDNIPSAFPRVRMTRIRKAYQDPYERIALMEEKYTIADNEYKVGDRFKVNELLMDLTKQPDDVKMLMDATIYNAILERPESYSHFHFGKYLAKTGLEKLNQNSTLFAEMLAGNKKLPINDNYLLP